MKKITTLFTLIAFTFIGKAQTITQANLPVVGETWGELIDTAVVSFPITAAGAGQTWDYSTSFNVNDTSGAAFIAPAAVPGGVSSNYPNANLAVFNTIDGNSSFFKTQTSGLFLY